MTVIAGFQCTDGLLMCADSEQGLSSESKSQTRKIQTYIMPSGAGSVAIGGAGDGDVIDYFQHELMQSMAQEAPQADQFNEWLTNFAKRMWHAHVRPWRGFAPALVPDVSFLIGLQTKGTYTLYKWERTFIYPVFGKKHVSIGIGALQSESLLDELQFSLPAKQMLLFAVRAMLRVKQLVQGCGGKTEVVFLRNEGTIIKTATLNIDALEYLVEEVDQFLREHVLRVISSSSELDEKGELKAQANAIKHFRARYKAILPRFFESAFGSF